MRNDWLKIALATSMVHFNTIYDVMISYFLSYIKAKAVTETILMSR